MMQLDTPKATIEEYVSACADISVERLRRLFHPDALMSGFFLGEFYVGSPTPFYDEILAYTPDPAKDKPYIAKITSVDIFGDIANVVLEETGYLGAYSLIDTFQLVRVDGCWRIISKSYTDS